MKACQRSILGDVATLCDHIPIVDQRWEFPKSTGLFLEVWRRNTVHSRRELDFIVQPEVVELPG